MEEAIEEIKRDADAILDAHYPGEATGAQAVAEALYGVFSTSGKLTYTVLPAAFQNLSNFSSMSMTQAPGRTYRYYPSTPSLPLPLFSFGSGLTYTTWSFDLLNTALSDRRRTLPVTWSLNVSNTGTVDSDEVVEVFFVPEFDRVGTPTPHRVLIDFKRIHVPAGASVLVEFTICKEQLQIVNVNGSRVSVKGNYSIEFTNGEDATVRAKVMV